MFNLFTILRLVKEFCELVPEDFDYVKDQLSLYAAMRDYLIEGIESVIPSSLNVIAYACNSFPERHATDIRPQATRSAVAGDSLNKVNVVQDLGTDILKQYKCTEKLYAFITDFIDADSGKEYKKILSKYLV